MSTQAFDLLLPSHNLSPAYSGSIETNLQYKKRHNKIYKNKQGIHKKGGGSLLGPNWCGEIKKSLTE